MQVLVLAGFGLERGFLRLFAGEDSRVGVQRMQYIRLALCTGQSRNAAPYLRQQVTRWTIKRA